MMIRPCVVGDIGSSPASSLGFLFYFIFFWGGDMYLSFGLEIIFY